MKVFISHSFHDKNKFDDLCFAFEHQSIPLWKPEEIAAGQALREELRSAIETCAVCVFIATQNSLTSGWCQAEIGAFWGAGKPVVVYLGDDKLKKEELPAQFQPDKWASTTREVADAVKRLVSEAAQQLINTRPANAFWLGHDLARAIRMAMFEQNNRSELDLNLRQALHHLEELGLVARDARSLLLNALKTHRSGAALSAEEQQQFITDIAKAKNEIGDSLAKAQPQFRGYPTIEAENRLNQEVLGL